MNETTTNNTNNIPASFRIDQAEIDKILADSELMEKILTEQGIPLTNSDEKPDRQAEKARTKSTRKQAVSITITILSLFVLGVFLLSPLIQFIERVIVVASDPDWTMHVNDAFDTRQTVSLYQNMISSIHALVHLIVTVIYVLCVIRIIQDWDTIRGKIPQYLSRLLPFFLFLLFDLSIVLVTIIRGPNEYDFSGHHYTFESIYFYILYPIAYFFCGMLLSRETVRKILINTFLCSALILNILELIHVWVVQINVFPGTEVTTVFHNRNHYGYFLTIVCMVSGMAFIYAERWFPKIFYLISFNVASIVMILDNTLGAYLAVGFALFLYLLYTFISQEKGKTEKGFKGFLHRFRGFWRNIAVPGSWQGALFVLMLYVAITLVMSLYYRSILSGFFSLFSDVGAIMTNAENADDAGSLRWGTWRKTFALLWDRPFTGYGVEGLLNTHHLGTPHNEFLQYAAFFGLPTLILYVAATCLTLWRAFKIRAKASPTTMVCLFTTIGYLTSSFFGVAIYYTTPFVYIFLGLTYSEYLKSGKESLKSDLGKH